MDVIARTPASAAGLMQLRWGRALLVVNSLVIVLAAVAVWQNFAIHRNAAFATTQNTARLLSHDLQASFDQLDLALLTLKGEFESQQDAPGWGAVSALADRQVIQLRRHASLEFLRVADASGRIVAGSALPLSRDLLVADRDYFIALRDTANAGLFVSAPMVGYLNKKWMVAFARRLNLPSGEFAGVVYALVSLQAFQDQFASLNLGPGSVVNLRALDLSTLARFPPPEAVGVEYGDKIISDEWRALLKASPEHGSYAAVNPDGIARYLSYERLGTYPFHIIIGLSRDQALSHWWRETAITSLLAIIILVTSTFVALSWRRINKDSRRIIELQTAALDHHREQLKLAVDGADLGYWTLDVPSGQTALDHKTRAIFGIAVDESTSDNRCFGAVHDDDRDTVSRAVSRTVEHGDKFEIRVRILHPDRSLRWIHSVGQLLPGSGKRTMIGIVRDITTEVGDIEAIKTAKQQLEQALEEKAASERELRALTASLEQRVEDEIGRRESAQQRLSHAQRLEAIGQLAGGIAHDFNNVIQVVQGCAEMIETAHAGDEATQRLVRLILDASSRGGTVTRRLLAFARHSELSTENVDVRELLASLMELLDHALGSGITIKLDLADDLPKLRTDKEQLETVLVNIAVNARDAMEGRGTLRLAAAAELIDEVDAHARAIGLRPGLYLRITASDTGHGMAPEVVARACEPFFTTKPLGQGTGLGLAMAKGFAAQSGGALDIETAVGRGTSVKLWFPAGDATAATTPAPREASAPAHSHPATVLIVDDNALVLDTLARQMSRLGFAVRRATNARDALDQIDDAIDLVVTDFSMPEMDGMRLIRQLHATRPRLPAILLTGFAGQAIEDEPSEVFCVLRKPATAAQLKAQTDLMLHPAHA